MKIRLKLIPLFAVLFTMLFVSNHAFASDSKTITIENEGPAIEITENLGVSESSPDGENNMITPFGLELPTRTHNVITDGTMSFQGNTNSTLFTNSYFTGGTQYYIKIVNNHATADLVVHFSKKGSWFSSDNITVPAGSTSWWFPKADSTSTLYYLQFTAPNNFSGTIM